MPLYRDLQRHLDALPGGFPETDTGVELRILEELFSPEEAELALHLCLLSEDARTIATRANRPLDETEARLEAMADKGLIFRSGKAGGPPTYMAAQFIVGIWELQVNRLTPELVHRMEAYMPRLMDEKAWSQSAQMRVVPIREAITPEMRILTYEDAEALIRSKAHFVLGECICRQEMAIAGSPCKNPIETCLSFGTDADFLLKTGAGRKISMDDALELLDVARKKGLVIQPTNGRDISWICFCCGCCCGILRTLKPFPNPGELVSTPFVCTLKAESCTGCGVCVKRCPMDALTLSGKKVVLDPRRCIGCGVCVTTCTPRALKLARKKEAPWVPPNIAVAALKLAWHRRTLTPKSLLAMAARSLVDTARSRIRYPK